MNQIMVGDFSNAHSNKGGAFGRLSGSACFLPAVTTAAAAAGTVAADLGGPAMSATPAGSWFPLLDSNKKPETSPDPAALAPPR